jgi:hypothetical protein
VAAPRGGNRVLVVLSASLQEQEKKERLRHFSRTCPMDNSRNGGGSRKLVDEYLPPEQAQHSILASLDRVTPQYTRTDTSRRVLSWGTSPDRRDTH